MRAVTLYAFGVTVYGNNDNIKKNAMIKKKHTDTERIDLFSLFYRVLLFRTTSFDRSN